MAGNGDFFRLGTRDAPSSSVTFVPVHCDPENGNEANNTNINANIASIASGGAHSMVVTQSESSLATGLNEYGQCGYVFIQTIS